MIGDGGGMMEGSERVHGAREVIARSHVYSKLSIEACDVFYLSLFI